MPAGLHPAGRIMQIVNVIMNTWLIQLPSPPIHNWYAYERICYMMVDAFHVPAGQIPAGRLQIKRRIASRRGTPITMIPKKTIKTQVMLYN